MADSDEYIGKGLRCDKTSLSSDSIWCQVLVWAFSRQRIGRRSPLGSSSASAAKLLLVRRDRTRAHTRTLISRPSRHCTVSHTVADFLVHYSNSPRYPNTHTLPVMLDDDDVFDSVTWESPATQGYNAGGPSIPTGPGFRQSAEESDPGHGPNDPKWEGFLITAVKDPVKELAETKDAYVSYLVTAKVRVAIVSHFEQALNLLMHGRRTCRYSRLLTHRLADGSRTSSSCMTTSSRTSQHVSCPRCPTSIAWVRVQAVGQAALLDIVLRVCDWRPIQS